MDIKQKMYQKFVNEALKAAEEGRWDDMVHNARQVPKNWDVWQQIPGHVGGLPDDGVMSLLKNTPEDSSSGVLFEIASNLHPGLSPQTLEHIINAGKEDGYVQEHVLSHPNWKPSEDHQNKKKASEFWRSYEKKVNGNHMAAIKSMFSGKPEQFQSHRGDFADSHGQHTIDTANGVLSTNAPDFYNIVGTEGGKNLVKLHDVIPHLKNHAEFVQSEIMKDHTIPKRYFGGKPHIKLYRGIGGGYADSLRQAAGHNHETNEVDDKKLTLKTAPLSSWTTHVDMATRFAASRGDHDGVKGKGVIISAWHPLDSVLHSGMHSVIGGQEHAHPSENEVVIGHPKEKMSIKTKSLEFQQPGGNEYSFRVGTPRLKKTDSYGTPTAVDGVMGESLEKGAAGDWKKEGYILKHKDDFSTPGEHRLSVKIYHPSQLDKHGSPVSGKGVAGSAIFLKTKSGGLKPLLVNVDSDHQRKGIASSLYSHAENVTGLKILPSDKQSDDAKALWSNPNRPFGKSIDELEKGAKGDWKEEYYYFKHTHNPKEGLHVITARMPAGHVVGEYHFSEKHHNAEGGIYPLFSATDPEHQRKGLATEAYRMIEEKTGKKLYPSVHQTKDAEQFWNSPDRTFGKSGDNLPGGKGDKAKDSDFSKKEVVMGHKVEMEHTYSPKIAAEVTRDHLAEDKAYYSKLKDAGLADELEKGLRGDWKKEGYTIHHEIIPSEKTDNPHWYPQGKLRVYAKDRGGNVVATASINHAHSKTLMRPRGVAVHDGHERKGIATAMYAHAEKLMGKKMVPQSGHQTPDGAAMWTQPNRPFGRKNEKNIEKHSEADLKDYNKRLGMDFEKSQKNDYKGEHGAPDPESGASMHDLKGTYPDDIYTGGNAIRLYGTGSSYDHESILPIQASRGRPNQKIRIYRAVPHTQTAQERMSEIEAEKAHIQKHGKVPPHMKTKLDRSDYYEQISDEYDRLKSQPQSEQPKLNINHGDWVTPSRSYAKEHGESNLGGKGKYKIISKLASARDLFTTGDSIHEWGYHPQPNKQKLNKSEQNPQVATIAVISGNKLLMGVRRDNGLWTCPGGHIEISESPHDGAVRELWEETGIKSLPLKSMGNPKVIKSTDGKSRTIHCFAVKIDDPLKTTLKNDPDGEFAFLKWVDCSEGLPEEIIDNLHVPYDRNVLLNKLFGV